MLKLTRYPFCEAVHLITILPHNAEYRDYYFTDTLKSLIYKELYDDLTQTLTNNFQVLSLQTILGSNDPVHPPLVTFRMQRRLYTVGVQRACYVVANS
jgi:hypothetical protein